MIAWSCCGTQGSTRSLQERWAFTEKATPDLARPSANSAVSTVAEGMAAVIVFIAQH